MFGQSDAETRAHFESLREMNPASRAHFARSALECDASSHRFDCPPLQPNRMSRLKSAGRPINRLPARRPFACVAIVWGGVEAQSGNDCKRVALARVNRDPSASARFAVTAKFGRTHWRTDQAGRAKHVGYCAGTIVTVIIK